MSSEAEWAEGVAREDEEMAIVGALREVLHGAYAIPEWEFEILLGVSREKTVIIFERLRDGYEQRTRGEHGQLEDTPEERRARRRTARSGANRTRIAPEKALPDNARVERWPGNPWDSNESFGAPCRT